MKKNTVDIKTSTVVMIIVGGILFSVLYLWYIQIDGIWIILVFMVFLLLLITGIMAFIEKMYPNSKTGKKIIRFLEKTREVVKEFHP